MKTAGTPRDNLLPRASSAFRAVVTKGNRTAEKALYSSRGLQEAALQDPHEGSGAQQRDGALHSSTESSPEGIADLHRVTLVVRVICQVRGRLPPLGRTLLALEGHTQVIAGQTVDPINLGPSRHDTPAGLATASHRSTGLPLLSDAASARPSAARSSTAPPPTSGSRPRSPSSRAGR